MMEDKRKAAAIGTFDGLHRGHLCVLDTLKEEAAKKGLQPIVFTFDRHPLNLINPEKTPPSLTSLYTKKRILREKGIEPVILEFDAALSQTTAKEWLSRMKKEFGVDLIVAGYDNTFGSDGVNYSIEDYSGLGKEVGVEVIEAPVVDGVSSSAVRKAVKKGEMEKAAEMLGRLFTLSGIVVEGNKLGRNLGFPTANLKIDEEMILPSNGVYAAEVILSGGEKYPGVVNIGVRPTLKRGDDLTVEAHIINWKGDLYGQKIKIRFVSKMRDEIEFKTMDELRKNIEFDKKKALEILQERAAI